MSTPTNKILVSIDGTELKTVLDFHAKLTADGATIKFSDHRVVTVEGRPTACVEFIENHPCEVGEHDAANSEEFYADSDLNPQFAGCTIEAKLVR